MQHPEISGTEEDNHGKIQSNIERNVRGLCSIPLECHNTPVVGQLFLLAHWYFLILLGARNSISLANKARGH